MFAEIDAFHIFELSHRNEFIGKIKWNRLLLS